MAIEELVFVAAQRFLSAVACRLEAVIVGLLFLARLESRYPGYLAAAVAHSPDYPAAAVAQYPAVVVAQLYVVADEQLQEQL